MNPKTNKTLIFNNGEPVQNITSAIVVNGTPYLSPRAYNLLNILAKKLMDHVLSTVEINGSILESIIQVKALRDTNISVEEYMKETGLDNPYWARDSLAQAGVELHSFFMSFQSSQDEGNSITFRKADSDEAWSVGFLQNLMGEGKIYEETGSLELEFYPTFVDFLIHKYREESNRGYKAEDYTADQLLSDMMLMGFSLIRDYGFEIRGGLFEHSDLLSEYIRSHYCLGRAPSE